MKLLPCEKCEYWDSFGPAGLLPIGGHCGWCEKSETREVVNGECKTFKIKRRAKK